MANIKELAKYRNYEFSSGGYTGEDYKSFERKYINYLKSIAKEYGWELVKANKNHYCFSAFLKHKYKYVYLSISDVRYSNDWFNKILFRTATSDTDYTGGSNQYTNLTNLKYAIYGCFNKE